MASSAIEIAIANSERIFVLLVPGFRFPRALRAGRRVTVLHGTANKQRPHENYCAASEAADTDMVKGASNKRASRSPNIAAVHAPYFPLLHRKAHVSTHLASPLLMEMASNSISSGDADKIIEAQKMEIAKRQSMANRMLADCNLSSHRNALHLWLKLPEPWRASQFKDELAKREVLVLSSDAFAIERSNQTHAIRISLGTPPSENKVMEGLKIIHDTLCKNT